MTRDEIKELGALYAIGALDPATASEVEQYLRTASAEERREIEQWQEAAAMLPLALPPISVPPTVKDRLFARINEGSTNEPAASQPAAPPPNLVPFTPPARIESQPARWLLVAATVTLAVLSGLLLWQNSRLTRQRDELAEQARQQSQERIAKQQELNQITSADTRVITLSGGPIPQASAKLFWDTVRQEWMVYLDHLPSPPAGKDYQLWYITQDQHQISAAVFRPDAQGHGEVRTSVPPSVALHLVATAVTLEPKGGSTQPTGPTFLKGAI